jgi:hypothetical protein
LPLNNKERVMKKLKRLFKFLTICLEKYGRWEHGKYDNGYYERSDK